MKLLCGEVEKEEYVGSSFFTVWSEVVMEVRASVSRIILAKPIKVVIIMHIDNMPPVTVRYSCSSSSLSSYDE